MTPLVTWVAALLHVCLTLYALLGGADLGAGVWDLLATGPRAAEQRAAIERTLRPTWEINHLLLLLLVGLLFFCFPHAYRAIGVALFLPLSALLLALIVRGVAFVFRTLDGEVADTRRAWGAAFGLASLTAPIALGVCLGATASGRIRHGLDAPRPTLSEAWWAPFPLATGALVAAVFAFLSAVYLAAACADEELREAFRLRALAASVAVTVTAWIAFFAALSGAPHLVEGLWRSTWAPGFHLATGALGLALLRALITRRYAAARALAIVQVAALFGGFDAAQYPYVVPPDLTLAAAAADVRMLQIAATVLTAALVALGPAYAWLWGALRAGRTEA